MQLILDILPDTAPTLDGFVPGRNGEALGVLRGMLSGTERERFLYLWGAPGCGRSHLLRAVADGFRAAGRPARYVPVMAGAAPGPEMDGLDCVAVDDVEGLPPEGQEALFHLYNRLREGGRGVLLASGDVPPARLGLRSDLVTRLGWGLVYELHGLSDGEKARAMERHAAARGFQLPGEVSDYLLRHGRRDLPWLMGVVDALDRHSLETKRPVTLPLLRELIQAPLDLGPGGDN
jgi:DnaA family protein